MRFMLIVKSTPESEAEPSTGFQPDPTVFTEMAAFHEELARAVVVHTPACAAGLEAIGIQQHAGVLLDANGLKPSRAGWRVHYDGARRTVTDGPFTETRELIAGYTLIQAASRAEAMEWARRFPSRVGAGQPAEVEVRELFELDDFAPSDEVERFRALDAAK